MNISARTKTIIDLVPAGHRHTAAMIGVITDVSAAYEGFSGHRIALQSKLKPQALGEELNKSFKENYGKQWVRINSSVAKLRAEIEKQNAALVVKPGPTTSAGAYLHAEKRTWLRSLDIGARQGIALSTEDPNTLHAMILEPQMSGLAGLPVPIIAEVNARYKHLVYPTEIAAIAADEAVIVPAEQAIHMARNEMRGTLDLHPKDFDEMLKGIEIGRVWLLKGRKQVCEVDSSGRATYRLATEDEAANGVEYENYSAFQTAQAA